jgi:outer membrane protein TolC
MKYSLFFFLVLLLANHANSQTQRSLEECLAASDAHLPLACQQEFISAANQLAQSNLRRNKLPQASLNGQATWQTDVTELPIQIPIPGFEVPTISQDQYRLTLDLVHSLWDGGQNNGLIALQEAQTQAELQRAKVDLYAAHEQTIQFYCAALLAQTQYQTIQAAKNDMAARKKRMEEQLANGTAIPAQVALFEARLLELEQQQDETLARKSAAFDALRLLTGLAFTAQDSLVLPPTARTTDQGNARPELQLFQLQQQSMLTQEQLAKAKLMPRINAIATFGYARPGLNFLSNDFSPYAILGINFKWNLHPLYTGTSKREKQQYRIQSERIALQKEQFLLQTDLKDKQQERDIERLAQLVQKDKRIIALRESIAATASIQLDNGVLTPSEYLSETTNVTTAKLTMQLHDIQLVQAYLIRQFVQGKL